MSAIDAPMKFELSYTHREEWQAQGKPDFDGFEPLEGDYATVSAKAVALNDAQLKKGKGKKGRINRLFFPTPVTPPAEDDD